LFSGPSGTGKALAAGEIARELGLDLVRIDQSRGAEPAHNVKVGGIPSS